jgi:hypothetical protein
MPDPVETTAPDGAQEPQTSAVSGQPPSSPVPATPPAPDVETALTERLETERRRWQASKDREFARLAQDYQKRERGLHEMYAQQLRSAGVENPDEFVQSLDLRRKAAAYDEFEQQRTQQEQTTAFAQDILDTLGAADYGIDLQHPAFREPMPWDQFREKTKELVREAAKNQREEALRQQEQEARGTVDARVASGQLATLGGGPAQPTNRDHEVAALLGELGNIQFDQTKRARRLAIRTRLAELGEEGFQ